MLNLTLNFRKPQIVITSVYQAVGLEINYRDENGVVFSGIRTGRIEAVEYRDDKRYPIGWYYKTRDNQYLKHTSWVYDGSVKGIATANVKIAI